MDGDQLIRRMEGYAPLSDEDKGAIRSVCAGRVVMYPARRDIISDGQATDYVHLILEGWAARYKTMPDGSRQITAFLIPGDFCDLLLTILEKMDYGVMALTPCKVAHLDTDSLEDISIERPVLLKAFLWIKMVDEAILHQWVVNSRRKAIVAIPHLLCELHLRLKVVGLVSDQRFELPMSQEIIGEATGMTPVHVNRTIRELREAGLIEIGRGMLTIPDVAALANAGEFDGRYLHLHEDRKASRDRYIRQTKIRPLAADAQSLANTNLAIQAPHPYLKGHETGD